MRAVKGAGTEMDDAGADRGGVVPRPRDRIGKRRERGARQAGHSVTPRFQIAISRSPLRSAAVSRPDATSAISPSSAAAPAFIPSSSTCRSEEHTSELQSLMRISYAVFCLKKKKNTQQTQ